MVVNVTCHQGTLTLPGHVVPSPLFWDLLVLQLLRPARFLELAKSLLDFSP